MCFPPPPLGVLKLVMVRVYLGGLLMKKIITCAVLASAALATPAFAQDEADKGMYFQLRTAVADLNNPDFAIIDTSSEPRSEEHTSELQSLMRISYAVFCLKQKTQHRHITTDTIQRIRKHNEQRCNKKNLSHESNRTKHYKPQYEKQI